MRIRRQQLATGCLGFLVLLSPSAQAASPVNIKTLVEEAKFNTSEKKDKIADKILKLDPKSGDANAMLATSKYMAHDIDGAIALNKKALELKFRDDFWKRSAYNYLYHGYIEKKDWAQALKYCQLCYKVEVTSGVAHDLSILYRKTGNMELSKEYESISEKMTQHTREEFQKTLTTLKQADDPKTVDTVLHRIDEGLAKNPKDTEALLMRAHCYRTKKQYAKELSDVNAVIAMMPGRGALYHHRSEIYKLLGDTKKSASEEIEAKRLGFDAEKIQQQMLLLEKRIKQRRSTTGSGTTNSDYLQAKPD